MPDLSIVLGGLSDAFTLVNLLFVAIGVAAGQMVGAIPGIGPIMAMAIAIPFTFAMDPLVAISFLVGINKGGLFGGAIPSILINTPGTPDAAATADGLGMLVEQAAEAFEIWRGWRPDSAPVIAGLR